MDFDKITIDAVSYNVKDSTARKQISDETTELNSRISTIIADGQQTEGNTELIDIRTGADGKVYPTAGDAVRGQIGELKEDYSSLSGKVDKNTSGISELKEEKINKPEESDNNKIARAKDGEVEWVDVGQPTDEQTADAVTKWLDKHPEATTTVKNESLTIEKFAVDVKKAILQGYIYADLIGMKCYTTEELAKEDKNNYANKNYSILQEYIKYPLRLGKGYYPISKAISMEQMVNIVGAGMMESCLVFNNSEGFVYNKNMYYQNGYMYNFSIISKNACINFDSNAYNIYLSIFENLCCTSIEGSCIVSAINNKSVHGDQLAFSLSFIDISTRPKLYSYVNISGLGNRWINCSDGGSYHKGMFLNCSGYFENVNTSFGGADYFLRYDNTMQNAGHIIKMINCNAESYKIGFIHVDDDSEQGFTAFDLENTSYTPDYTVLDRSEPPCKFYTMPLLFNLKNANIIGKNFPNGYNESVKCGIYIRGNSLPKKFNIDSDLQIYSISNKFVFLLKAFSNVLSIINISKMTYRFDELQSDLFVGARYPSVYMSNISTYYNEYFNLADANSPYADVIKINFDDNKDLRMIINEPHGILKNISRIPGDLITVKNEGKGVVTLHNTDANYGFYLENDLMLSSGNSYTFIGKYMDNEKRWYKLC